VPKHSRPPACGVRRCPRRTSSGFSRPTTPSTAAISRRVQLKAKAVTAKKLGRTVRRSIDVTVRDGIASPPVAGGATGHAGCHRGERLIRGVRSSFRTRSPTCRSLLPTLAPNRSHRSLTARSWRAATTRSGRQAPTTHTEDPGQCQCASSRSASSRPGSRQRLRAFAAAFLLSEPIAGPGPTADWVRVRETKSAGELVDSSWAGCLRSSSSEGHGGGCITPRVALASLPSVSPAPCARPADTRSTDGLG
jgi:hypothetical protein